MPIPSQIASTNNSFHNQFKAGNPNTIWQYYKLIGVQAAPVNGPPAANAPTDDLSYYYLANIVVETNQALQNFTGDGFGDLFRMCFSTARAIRWAAAKVVTASRANTKAGI